MLNRRAWLLHFIRDDAPSAARDSSEVARALSRFCYPHTETAGVVGVLAAAAHPGRSGCPLRKNPWMLRGSLPLGLLTTATSHSLGLSSSTPLKPCLL